jgi:hypothetical protein
MSASKNLAAPEAVALPSSAEVPNPLTPSTHAARALIGWMSPHDAALAMAGRNTDKPPTAEMIARAARARAHVAARAPGADQSGVMTPAPAVLDAHVAALAATPAGARVLGDRWSVCIVDLRRICAFQPTVTTAYAEDRAAGVDATDVTSLAQVSLPLPTQQPLSMMTDAAGGKVVCASRNPNLKVLGQFSTPIEPGVVGVGFAVSVMPSFMSVAVFQGRHLLYDGYHRAHGFLRRGIYHVPALVREFGVNEQMNVPAGMLPNGSFLGDRPPLLLDYLDDNVAADVTVPATQKLVIVQGLEFGILG